MSTAAISTLKNQLPEWIHKAEQGEDIQITRHGKPVAVIVSLERYQRVLATNKGVFNAYLRWRAKHPQADGMSDDELNQLYQRTRAPHETRAVWD
ncbi:MAG: type II toxin-antitoxin system Phd/YefM family antitoxin [Halothiobacillaceae bacterium]|nr:type II toxin-antitoxin system Phd/YefM family antitoxin [Halothiobacillaceae bacterium]